MLNKIKVLFIYQDLDAGGSEEVLASTVKNINKEKYEIFICCIDKKGSIGAELEELGFNIICLNRSYDIFNFITIMKLYGVIKKIKPSIVHTSLFYANFHGRMAAILSGVPVIVSEEQNIYKWKGFVFRTIDRIMAIFTAKIIACSKTVMDFTASQEKISSDKFTVIYNTFDIHKFDKNAEESALKLRERLNIESGGVMISAVGRLCEQKGHEYLIRAMELVVKKFPNVRLIITGEGPLKKKLEEQALKAGVGDYVVFMDKTRDIPGLLSATDIFVLPSLWEGLSVVLFEAMYMAKPIVASNISSNMETMVNNETGLLVQPADYNALALGIISLIENPEKSKNFGIAAKKKAMEFFNPGARAARLEELYEKEIYIKRS